MVKEILEKIKEYDTIIIHRHSRPDGDALGSQIGLKEIILENFDKQVYVVGDETNRLSFIGKMDTVQDEFYQNALVFVLDTADVALIGDERFNRGAYLIKIDHHISRSDFGHLNLVDTSFESCAGLIAHIALELGLNINKKAALALFTGIVTDSGRFRYESTNSRTFNIVAKLLESGINPSDVYDNLYIEELESVRLKAHFMLNFKLTTNNVAYMLNTKEDIASFDTNFFTVSRGMVNTMAGIKGINIWANFTEDVENNCIVAELRSNKYNINEIAVKYGGGGHRLASGASLDSWEKVEKMLEDLDKLMMEEI